MSPLESVIQTVGDIYSVFVGIGIGSVLLVTALMLYLSIRNIKARSEYDDERK